MIEINRISTVILLASCLVSLIEAQGYQPKFEYSEEEAKLYRMPIKQITPKDGIKTGHVIAYGHYIKPPYKIEVRDTTIFINNVQVWPTLMTPGMIEKEKKEAEMEKARKKAMQDYIRSHQAEYDEMRRIDSLAKVLYEETKASKGKEAAVNAVMELYSKSVGVDSVRINSLKNGEIDIFYKVGTIQYELQRINGYKRPEGRTVQFEPYGKCASVPDIYKTQEEREADMKRMGFPTTKQGWAELWAKHFEERLLNGNVLDFSGCSIYFESELLSIAEILSDKTKSMNEKYNDIRKILRATFIHAGILMILTNYESHEWNQLRRQK